jgi:hypothetical protein
VILTRRDMLQSIAVLAATALSSCQEATDTPDSTVAVAPAGGSDTEILASVAYDLFPFTGLTPELYLKAATALLALNDPAMAEGLASLRAASGTTAWMDLPEPQRIAVLTAMEKTAFFTLARATTISVLFREPALFDLVGYGGSAIDKGGYLNRGFDQITWLPEAQ